MKKADISDIEDANMILVLLMSLAAYEEETGEKFSVDKAILAPMTEKAIQTGHTEPMLALEHTEDGRRLQLSVAFEKEEDHT